MANKTITISREEYRHKVMSQITELGATGGGASSRTILCLSSL